MPLQSPKIRHSDAARRAIEEHQLSASSVAFYGCAPTSADAENLSPRERQVLELLSSGFIYKEIGDQLNIGVETVRTYVKGISNKMHVRSRLEAIAKFQNKSEPRH